MPVVAPQHEVAIADQPKTKDCESSVPTCRPRTLTPLADADLSSPNQSIGGNVRCCPRQGTLRQSVGRLLNLVRLATALPFRDMQRGFRLFSPAAHEPIFSCQRMDGLSPDVDHLMIARLHGSRVAAVPASWNNTDVSKRTLPKTPRSLADPVRLESKPRAEFPRGKS